MSDTAIRVEKLGKRYRIGQRERYDTLRDTVARSLSAPFRWLKDISNFERRMSNLADTQSGLGNLQSPIQNSPSGIADSQFAIRNSQSVFIWALKDVSFEVKQGEVVGIIGRNGAGKSTLLKILSRITMPTEGEAEVFGRVGSLLEVGTGFHPELTGRENIYLNGAILGMRHSELDRKFDEIVAFADIEKFIDTPVKRYSSGMYMRLAFSVAAHLEPEILLVDEVLSVGDVAFQKKCLGKMGDVAKRGRTILFVSHQMFAVRTLCERALWLDEGRVAKDGPAFEVVGEFEETLLHSAHGAVAVVARNPESVRGMDFYISRVEMRSPETDESSCIFSYNASAALIIDTAGECPTPSYSVEFRIYKESGEFACVGASGVLHGIYFDRSTKRIGVDVGPLILTNGRYGVSLRLLMGTEIFDDWEHACAFQVVDCFPFAVPREITVPVCVIQHAFRALG